MKRNSMRKWLLCVAMLLVVLFPLLFVTSGKDFAGYGEADMVPAQITAPQSVMPIDYNLPGNRLGIGVEGAGSSAAAKEDAGERYLMYCFLIQIFSLLLFLHYICHVVLRRFGGYKIMLWHNVLHIHKSDGKKKIAFCNE